MVLHIVSVEFCYMRPVIVLHQKHCTKDWQFNSSTEHPGSDIKVCVSSWECVSSSLISSWHPQKPLAFLLHLRCAHGVSTPARSSMHRWQRYMIHVPFLLTHLTYWCVEWEIGLATSSQYINRQPHVKMNQCRWLMNVTIMFKIPRCSLIYQSWKTTIKEVKTSKRNSGDTFNKNQILNDWLDMAHCETPTLMNKIDKSWWAKYEINWKITCFFWKLTDPNCFSIWSSVTDPEIYSQTGSKLIPDATLSLWIIDQTYYNEQLWLHFPCRWNILVWKRKSEKNPSQKFQTVSHGQNKRQSLQQWDFAHL